ncbi:KTSC domain-containing protein [Candidatus Methylospira mobilis]|uniref:KTSC domain-containing protein n=1 Tax=Candidatus Methylospira mobilis TaxID=1808979 RepID=UPI0028EDB23F|nr:KTSC domain-containing protein [Candidatus Methylospira mobilis]WNV04034.1 KTSC domain-containing protein [Candidatus Methylospira mobilis]
MNWIDVQSTNIARMAYDETNRILKIEFQNGSLYDYFDIPDVVFDGIRNSPSKGQYLAQQIKGHYRYARV